MSRLRIPRYFPNPSFLPPVGYFLIERQSQVLLEALFQRLLRRFFSALLEGVRPDLRALLRAPVAFGNLPRCGREQMVERGDRLRGQLVTIRTCRNKGEFVIGAWRR